MVYAAHDVRLERDVAIKVLRADVVDDESLRRFEQEAKTLARLRHPNILEILSVGGRAGITFMVMPLLKGRTLRAHLDAVGVLSFQETIRIAVAVAEALSAAHEAGVIHRDVKPENIFLEGDRQHVLLMDFGIARALTAADIRLTASGAIIGSPRYMSPEQAAGRTDLDARSDIYSLGCVVFEMLTGVPPFGGNSPGELVARHIADAPPLIGNLRPRAPDTVEEIIRRALAKSPRDRFETAQELVDALRAFGDELNLGNDVSGLSSADPTPGAATPEKTRTRLARLAGRLWSLRGSRASPRSPSACDRSDFVRDVTVPDGTRVGVGEAVTKVWEIRNSGNVPWNGRFMERQGPNQGPGRLRSPVRTKVPYTLPGDTARIVVRLRAPSQPGSCYAEWKMVDQSGRLLLPRSKPLFVSVDVVESRR